MSAHKHSAGGLIGWEARRLRAAIAGAGLMGRWHAHASRRHGARVIGIADIDIRRAKTLARQHPGAEAVACVEPLLREGQIDVVHICTPLPSHAPLIRSAIQSGVHALVEKPFAASAAETSELLEAAARARLVVCPVHQLAFQRGIGRLAARLSTLGPIVHTGFTIFTAGGAGRAARGLDELVADILPHPLAVLRRLWPTAEWTPGHWRVTRAGPGELMVSGMHAGGLLSLLISVSARPTCFDLVVHGANGTAEADLFHGFAVFHPGAVSRLRKLVRPFASVGRRFGAASYNIASRALSNEYAYPGLGDLVGRFYEAALGGGNSPLSAEDTMAVARARDTLVRALHHPMQASETSTASIVREREPQAYDR